MTWTEIREALKGKPVVMMPLGSVEQHGPHTPVGDYLATKEIARRVAESTGALFIPTLPYGYSETHRGFPGTLTLRPSTLAAFLEDLAGCLVEEGADHILFLCGHGGNVPTIEHVARELMRTRRLRTACIDLWRMLPAGFNAELYATPSPNTGHGSEPIGSVMAYLAPHAIRPDLRAAASRAAFAGLPARGSQVELEGHLFHIYPRSVDTSPVGVIGDPALAEAGRGKRILEYVTGVCCKIVRWFAELDCRVDDPVPGG
jgi:creatinine amidohydrolase